VRRKDLPAGVRT